MSNCYCDFTTVGNHSKVEHFGRALEVAETEALVNSYYAALRAAELFEATKEELRAAEGSIDEAELERLVVEILEKLAAASVIAATQDGEHL